MFRNPREQTVCGSRSPVKSSIGRPPTPPSTHGQITSTNSNPMSVTSPLSVLEGESPTSTRPSGGGKIVAGKAKGKANGSILNFFKKAELPSETSLPLYIDQDELFLPETEDRKFKVSLIQTPTPPRDSEDTGIAEETFSRYNEDVQAIKRRRINDHPATWPNKTSEDDGTNRNAQYYPGHDTAGAEQEETHAIESLESAGPCLGENVSTLESTPAGSRGSLRGKGPFIADSDSDDDMIKQMTSTMFGASTKTLERIADGTLPEYPIELECSEKDNIPPSLAREQASIPIEDDFYDIDDFIDDEFPVNGEEYVERCWMDEQDRLESEILEIDGLENNTSRPDVDHQEIIQPNLHGEAKAGSCPICNGSLAGITVDQASIHVNQCLDGSAQPLPPLQKPKPIPPPHKRFQQAAIARPGQSNPFSLPSTDLGNSSAFSKLMSNHAEDAAWASAAAAELAARGKPAFKRTCPFYKILPGFFICVDAFRYGAVEGCKAYFLSHFHSDHYIGLTSTWCHGPIYCSRVTGNLVRRQLRVDPKWVVDLEFDSKIEVPGTSGVDVTMIPANHCPGSSLYLFEKTVGRGKSPKIQRVLHCGDFRACPAHVQHPLLRPDVMDVITGKSTRQQKLDVCYLDTTYLTPKYAFPCQEEVIKACADMCVSLSKEELDETDDWEMAVKERAGGGMVKFVQKALDPIGAEVTSKAKGKGRGRLLVIVGTYSIGKERICLGVAKALNSKIYAPPNKQKICAALDDPELMARMTNNPLEAQVHMQMLMEIRAETLADYLTGYKPHFSRIVGFRPSGWNYRPPNSRFVESPAVQTVLYADSWKSRYSMAELVPQRGSTREASCFGVPYSEHSSFRELTMFCCALRIDKIIPTVNVGSAKSREKMKAWCEKWAMEKKKNGLFKFADGQTSW